MFFWSKFSSPITDATISFSRSQQAKVGPASLVSTHGVLQSFCSIVHINICHKIGMGQVHVL
ncbi:ORF97 [White spot syndrome virus]|uniref:Wsv022 n=3 Tax=White spot syndrome virus TaxID=342409 RepID=Q8VBE0_WSSVS|nr:wsv022 [Shrimp white spot syndrome virus]AFX59399.1 wsv022 [White spot syndrome virus]AAL33026.1 wsv022 [Shrimp white spot syndrome virus]AAL88946.1 WSSV078 [Shrimp white spot syndrome virus]ATU84183.1 ORF97 [White spot syndrome virus]AWQ60212.1 wsv022 [Shrimp white spot syndrome virus]